MKTLLATAALLGGLVISASGTASAATAYECEQYAQNVAEQQYPTGGGALAGGVGGGFLGAGIAAATGGNVGAGAGIGAGIGLAVGSSAWQAKKKQVHDSAYASCIGPGQPLPVYAPPPPVNTGPFSGIISGAMVVNVRTGPGTNFPAIGQVYQNQGISVAGCGGGWCQIYLSNGTGFVSANYVTPVSG